MTDPPDHGLFEVVGWSRGSMAHCSRWTDERQAGSNEAASMAPSSSGCVSGEDHLGRSPPSAKLVPAGHRQRDAFLSEHLPNVLEPLILRDRDGTGVDLA